MSFSKKKGNINTKSMIFGLICFLIIPIIANVFKYLVLPDKYFYDYIKVLALVNGEKIDSDSSFDFAAGFFSAINIFHFSTLIEWSIFLGTMGNVLLFLLFLKRPCSTPISHFFLLMLSFLLNIYVFIIGKEAIQFLFFYFWFLAYHSKQIGSNTKNLLVILSCIFEGLFFRGYYLVVALLYVVFLFLSKFKIPAFKKSILVLCFIVIGMLLLKFFMPSTFSLVINLRNNLNAAGASSDRRTMINDVLFNTRASIFIFIINYLINLIRISIPFELLLSINPLYFAFFIFQIIYSSFLLLSTLSFRKFSRRDKFIVIFLISYYFTLNLFEPDFGSLARHECVSAPLLVSLLGRNDFILAKPQILRFTLKRQRNNG
jgi:hypothetical protein